MSDNRHPRECIGHLLQLLSYILCSDVCVPKKHPVISVAADHRNLGHEQSHFEKSGDRFMTKVVQGQILDSILYCLK
jgi:hypothetical protein